VDLRERAIAALEGGMKRSQVCQVFGIHRNTLRRWRKLAQNGTLENKPLPGLKRKLGPEDDVLLLTQLEEHADATIDEHLRLWQEGEHPPVSRATLGRAILRVQWTRKKRA